MYPLFFKRLLDLFLSLTILICLSPLLIILIIVLRLSPIMENHFLFSKGQVNTGKYLVLLSSRP